MYRSLSLATAASTLAVAASLLAACGGGGGDPATTTSPGTTDTGSTNSGTTHATTTSSGASSPVSTTNAGATTAPVASAPLVVPAGPVPQPLALSTSTKTASDATDPVGSRALEVSYLNAVVPPSLMDYSHLEVAATTDLRSMSDGAGPFLGLRTYQGQPLVNGGVRAEVSVDYPFVQGQTVRYSWRFGITSDFVSDAPTNRWWLFGDWHDQPDPNLGQTWASYVAHSPSVGLGYGRIDGQDYLSLLYGAPDPSPVTGLVPFSRGVWHTLVAEITWSQGADGRITLYLDGSLVQQASGANMYNDYQHYLKLGTYRQPDIAGDTWVYVRDVKIETIR